MLDTLSAQCLHTTFSQRHAQHYTVQSSVQLASVMLSIKLYIIVQVANCTLTIILYIVIVLYLFVLIGCTTIVTAVSYISK